MLGRLDLRRVRNYFRRTINALQLLAANFCLGHAGDTVKTDTKLYQILDKDPGHHVVSYLSSLHSRLCLSKKSSALISLGPTTDAFLLRFCHCKPYGPGRYLGNYRFTSGLRLMRSHTSAQAHKRWLLDAWKLLICTMRCDKDGRAIRPLHKCE